MTKCARRRLDADEPRRAPTVVGVEALGRQPLSRLDVLQGHTRFVVLRPVTVDAMMTKTAATTIATIQRTQSMPGLPFPPKAE